MRLVKVSPVGAYLAEPQDPSALAPETVRFSCEPHRSVQFIDHAAYGNPAREVERRAANDVEENCRLGPGVRHDGEEWSITGRRMKQRLDAALMRRPVAVWSEARGKQRERIIRKAASLESAGIVAHVFKWALRPNLPGLLAHRRPGRPACRWTDGVPIALMS